MIKAMASSTFETTHAINAFVKALEKVRNDAERGFRQRGRRVPEGVPRRVGCGRRELRRT